MPGPFLSLMKKLILLFTGVFLLLLPLLGRAQEYRIGGRVVDAKTKEPVPFAILSLQRQGTHGLTNEKGYFQLLGSGAYAQDSLLFMLLGFSRRALLVERGKAEDLLVELAPQTIGPFISCPVKPHVVEPASKDEIIEGAPNSQYAFFISNENRRQSRKMRTVSFYIGDNGLPMKAFCIRIYKADGKNHSPHSLLLKERVFLTVPRSGEWYNRDLSRYNIVVPQEGYFVALEFGESASALPQPDMDKYIPSGQMMWPACDLKKKYSWSYSLEKSWVPFPLSKSSCRYSAMIKVEVDAVD